MPRARNIKPSLFKNEILGEEDPLLTLLFIGLWTLADREGRLEDRPKRIKAELFPYREIDVNGYLTELERLLFICRYTVENIPFIQILTFSEHQHPHKTEKPSVIPSPPENINQNKEMLCNGNVTVKTPKSNGSCPADSSNTDSSNTERESANAPLTKKASRLQKDWVLSDKLRQWTTEYIQDKGIKTINIDDEELKFYNYWTSKSKDATKLDWDKTWQNWILNHK